MVPDPPSSPFLPALSGSATGVSHQVARSRRTSKLARGETRLHPSQCDVQLAYAIGVADPVSILVNAEGTSKVSEDLLIELIREHFPLTPRRIIDYLDLLRPIYMETARHGHFGRALPQFTWEKCDKARALKEAAAAAV